MMKYTLLSCTLLSTFAFADAYSVENLYGESGYVGAAGTFSSSRDAFNDESVDSLGLNLTAGAYFLPYLGFEAGYGWDAGLFSGDDFEHVDLQLTTRYPLSDYAEVYLGIGASYLLSDAMQGDGSNVDTMASFGVRYHMTPSLALNVGYKFYNDPGVWDKSVGSLAIGLNYYFGSPAVTQVVSPPIRVEPAPVEPAPVVKETISPPVPVVKSEPVCRTERVLTNYTIKEGDWLNKLARENDMTLIELMEVNSGFVKKLSDLDLIYPGTSIKMYQSTKVCK